MRAETLGTPGRDQVWQGGDPGSAPGGARPGGSRARCLPHCPGSELTPRPVLRPVPGGELGAVPAGPALQLLLSEALTAALAAAVTPAVAPAATHARLQLRPGTAGAVVRSWLRLCLCLLRRRRRRPLPAACRLLFLLPRSLRCFLPVGPWGGLRGRPAGPAWPNLARKTSQGRCLAPCSRVGHGVGPSKGLWLG